MSDSARSADEETQTMLILYGTCVIGLLGAVLLIVGWIGVEMGMPMSVRQPAMVMVVIGLASGICASVYPSLLNGISKINQWRGETA